MKGTTMSDLFDYLKNNHEIEFFYCDGTYTIQPGGLAEQSLWSIWKDDSNSKAECICEYISASETEELDSSIRNFLNTSGFAGKSFNDIEADVVVEVIF